MFQLCAEISLFSCTKKKSQTHTKSNNPIPVLYITLDKIQYVYNKNFTKVVTNDKRILQGNQKTQ